MLEVIAYKLPSRNRDDLHWPLLTTIDEPVVSSGSKNGSLSSLFDSDDDRDAQSEDLLLSGYWESIREKYQQLHFSLSNLTQSKVDNLPAYWTVIHIHVTEDQNTMFVCRQRAGQQPLVFSLPLKGRRETEEDEHLTFEDATAELREIIRLSDEGTKNAINVKGQDRSARAAWWAERMELDKRLKELLDSIEFCWFGAFKVIFLYPSISPILIWCRLSSALKSRSLRVPCRRSGVVWTGYLIRLSGLKERSKALGCIWMTPC